MKLLYPVPSNAPITQTFAEHVKWAKVNGWCHKPGPCPSGVYYYGGVDFFAPMGTTVLASADGVVSDRRWAKTGYGYHVRIAHNIHFMTIYAHLRDIVVDEGQDVRAGDFVGYLGNTGNSTGPHLHFELRKDGVPIDPAPYLVKCIDEEPEPVEIEIPQFPELPVAEITADPFLNIRTGPGTANPVTYHLNKGELVEVICLVRGSSFPDGNDLWMVLGYCQYAAMRYRGKVYAKWVK